jgi:peptidoglycan hydrolase-like protein with peptidoglycan-binding domain
MLAKGEDMEKYKAIIAKALKEIGNKENPPNSNRTKYGEWYGMNGVPWCAIFTSWIYDGIIDELSQIPPKNKKGFAYCPNAVNYFKRKNRFNKTPTPGSLVFFNWNSDIAQHVGIVVSINNNNGSITTVEGNTSAGSNSNGGEVQKRTRSTGILGYGHCLELNSSKTITPSTPPTTLTLNKLIKVENPIRYNEQSKQWQQRMVDLNYLRPPDVDGYFGPKSKAALEKFQRDHKLEIDGILGPQSWSRAFR